MQAKLARAVEVAASVGLAPYIWQRVAAKFGVLASTQTTPE
jgi:hypothetical protein